MSENTGFDILPSDTLFRDSPDEDHPKCLCSRCGNPISEEQMALRVWPKNTNTEYRFCEKCGAGLLEDRHHDEGDVDLPPNLPAGVNAVSGVVFTDPSQAKVGKCCACCARPAVVLFLINRRCPTAEQGAWGCFVCGAKKGAAVVLCAECWKSRAAVRYGCDGAPAEAPRLPIEMFTIPCNHDLSRHPELSSQ